LPTADLYRYDAELEQYLYNGRYRLTTAKLPNQPEDSTLKVYGNGVSKASYINWIVDYNQQLGINSTDALTEDLANLDVRLCYRAASFVAQQNLAIFLEKGSPQSQNSSLLVPPESYNLILYKKSTIQSHKLQCRDCGGGRRRIQRLRIQQLRSLFQHPDQSSHRDHTDSFGRNISVTVPSQYTDKVHKYPMDIFLVT
jgi:hypothetical protein